MLVAKKRADNEEKGKAESDWSLSLWIIRRRVANEPKILNSNT
jgi:hypothetical protein